MLEKFSLDSFQSSILSFMGAKVIGGIYDPPKSRHWSERQITRVEVFLFESDAKSLGWNRLSQNRKAFFSLLHFFFCTFGNLRKY